MLFSGPPGKYPDSTYSYPIILSLHILPNSLFTNNMIIHYVIDNKSVSVHQNAFLLLLRSTQCTEIQYLVRNNIIV